MFGDLISAAASLFSNSQAQGWNEKMAKSGIQMRVKDAKAAGIHPLAALGANIQSVPGQPVMGDAALAGLKNIGDSIAPTEQQRLANEEARARIRNTEAQTMETVARSRTIAMAARQPPGAVVGTTTRPGSRGAGVPGSPPAHGALGLGRVGTLSTDPRVADAQTVQDRYGDIVENLHGLGIALPHDLYRSLRDYFDRPEVTEIPVHPDIRRGRRTGQRSGRYGYGRFTTRRSY